MEVEYVEKRRAFEKDGLTFAVFSCRLPIPDGTTHGAQKIAGLYEKLAARLCDEVEKKLFPAALAAYEKNEDPRRRFTLRPLTLELSGEVFLLDGKVFSVMRRIRYTAGKTRRELCFGETFSLRDGALLSPRALTRADKKLRKEARRARGAALRKGSISFFYPDGRRRDFPYP